MQKEHIEKEISEIRNCVMPCSEHIQEVIDELIAIEDEKLDFHDILEPALEGRAVLHLRSITNWMMMPHTRPMCVFKLDNEDFNYLVWYLLWHLERNSLTKVWFKDILKNLEYNKKRFTKEENK